MSLTLDPQTEKRIQQEVELGHYDSPSDLINDLLNTRNSGAAPSEDYRQYMHDRLEQAWEDLKQGDFISGERIEEMLAQRAAKHRA